MRYYERVEVNITRSLATGLYRAHPRGSYLGSFQTLEAARAARDAAPKTLSKYKHLERNIRQRGTASFQVTVNGVTHLGTFGTLHEAREVRDQYRAEEGMSDSRLRAKRDDRRYVYPDVKRGWTVTVAPVAFVQHGFLTRQAAAQVRDLVLAEVKRLELAAI